MTPTNNAVPLARVPDPSMDGLDDCMVESRLEIASILSRLRKHAVMLTAYIGRRSDSDFILTSLMSVDAESDELVAEFGADAGANQRALSADLVTFVGMLDGVRIEFAVKSMRQAQLQGLNVFISPLPASLLRLQRRNFFRVSTLAQALKCRVPAQTDIAIASQTLDVMDISCGGVKLACPVPTNEIERGVLLAGCRWLLPDAAQVVADLRVRNLHRTTVKGMVQTYIGCEFTDIAEHQRAPIQRFINLIERSRNRLR